MAIWTIKARRQLRHSLARSLCARSHVPNDGGSEPASCVRLMDDKMQNLNDILAATFPDAENIVVQDLFSGFRSKEDQHVLLVEVVRPNQGGPYIVKIGPVARLLKELNGWNSCRPAGLIHDLVFLPLERHDQAQVGGEPRLISLVYGDAQQFIGVERTVPLEEAVLQSVRFGIPTVQSIAFVLVELFERIGHLLYATSFVDDPATEDYVFRIPGVPRGLNVWKTDSLCQSVRTDTNVLVNHGVSQFLDPVDYFEKWILPYFSWEETLPKGESRIHPPTERLANPVESSPPGAPDSASECGPGELSPLTLPRPGATNLVPYMLRGCAHGDLHGRNILVGLVRERALWPTVFDYEDMGPCNLLGWDFVKLETELKIRAVSAILPREEPNFLRSLRDFEIGLNEATERHHLDTSWPIVMESADPLDRLRTILLELRKMAAVHLGINRSRPRQWLEEYYFLLAAYGVNSANFGNLERRELIGAYVSAGVAAARLSWPRRRETMERKVFGL